MGNRKSNAFTLVELLIVIGIIAVLISILVPVVGKIRTASYEASTRALITQIDQACQAYYQDYRAYPGPLPNSYLDAATQANALQPGGTSLQWKKTTGQTATLGGTAQAGGTTTGSRVTASENLVLGLCGGLTRTANGTAVTWTFDPTELGGGPRGFNPVRPSRAQAYFPAGRSLAKYDDNFTHFEEDPTVPMTAGAPTDSAIPEFVDGFSSPIPIIYARARSGVTGTGAAPTAQANPIVVADPDSTVAQYNLIEITPYTMSAIGQGRTVKQTAYVGATYNAAKLHGLQTVNPAKSTNKAQGANYQFPYDAYDYFSDPSSYDRNAATPPAVRQPRKKDQYVLISAGRDRVYGTDDDLTNFGTVLP